MKEKCATVQEALSSIKCADEMEGFTWGLRNLTGAMPVTKDEWAVIARRKIDLKRAK